MLFRSVPVPKNGSSTTSPMLDDAIITRYNKLSGFCVGWSFDPFSPFKYFVSLGSSLGPCSSLVAGGAPWALRPDFGIKFDAGQRPVTRGPSQKRDPQPLEPQRFPFSNKGPYDSPAHLLKIPESKKRGRKSSAFPPQK